MPSSLKIVNQTAMQFWAENGLYYVVLQEDLRKDGEKEKLCPGWEARGTGNKK